MADVPMVEMVDAPLASVRVDDGPGAWIAQALRSGASPNDLKELYALYEKTQAEDARRAFARAFARAKASMPAVPRRGGRNAVGKQGIGLNYSYAVIEDIAATAQPHLDANDLSYVWYQRVDLGDVSEIEKVGKDGIAKSKLVARGTCTVTCTLMHVGGHSISSTTVSPIESAAGMSPQQMVNSAIQMGRRQSLISVLGIVSAEPDPELLATALGIGRVPTSPPITAEQADSLTSLIEFAGRSMPKLLAYYGVGTIGELTVAQYEDAVRALKAVKK